MHSSNNCYTREKDTLLFAAMDASNPIFVVAFLVGRKVHNLNRGGVTVVAKERRGLIGTSGRFGRSF